MLSTKSCKGPEEPSGALEEPEGQGEQITGQEVGVFHYTNELTARQPETKMITN